MGRGERRTGWNLGCVGMEEDEEEAGLRLVRCFALLAVFPVGGGVSWSRSG